VTELSTIQSSECVCVCVQACARARVCEFLSCVRACVFVCLGVYACVCVCVCVCESERTFHFINKRSVKRQKRKLTVN
jgi:hypothetical protein